jgi:AraC-like DNA-binding protein
MNKGILVLPPGVARCVTISLMSWQSPGHDRDPGTRDPNPAASNPAASNPVASNPAALSDALDRLRLRGAIFLRGEYTEGWAYESLPATDVANLLVPGAPRVILFHVVDHGRCWIETEDGVRLWADAGDVIVLPYGDAHRMGGTEDALMVSVASLIDPPPWTEMPVIHHGAGGTETHVVCGYLTSDDPLFDPRLRALPPVFVVHPPSGAARQFVRSSVDYALQQTSRVDVDRFEAPTDIPQLLVREVLKIHLAGAPAAERGWLNALRDPVLAPALAAMHGDPGRKWTVAELARAANVSVSSLDERFRALLGMPPIRYLTDWRMHIARDLLECGDRGVGAVARQVGYESEEAFSRAFKRAHGVAPSLWRRGLVAAVPASETAAT